MPYLEHEKFTDYYLSMSLEEVKIYMFQLVNCLELIHAVNIVHRDLKPDNFLYNSKTKKCLLIDFGLSDVIEDETNQESNDEDLKAISDIQRTYNLKNRIGTRGFMAPETIFNSILQGKGVDIWAAGVIFLSFLSKRFPVLNLNKFSPITSEVIKDLIPLIYIFGRNKVNEVAKKLRARIFISECFDQVTQTNPCSLRDLCARDDVDENAKDLLEKLLEIDFEKRISATEAKKHPFFNSIRSEWENKNKTSF